MGNRIPRKFDYIIAVAKTDSNAGRVGDRFHVCRDQFGTYYGTNMRTEKEYQIFVNSLRNEHYFDIERIA